MPSGRKLLHEGKFTGVSRSIALKCGACGGNFDCPILLKPGIRGDARRKLAQSIGKTQRDFRVMALTLAEANTIIKAAIAKAQELNIIVCVAVCNNQGRLVALNRMDGALVEVDQFAIGKAISSAESGLPSGKVVSHIDHPPVGVSFGQVVARFCVRGGLPIFRDGQIEGACGVDGQLSHELEEECARSGIARLQR